LKKILITLGEPAGIGPDLGVLLAQRHLNKSTIVIADPKLLTESAKTLKKKIKINVLKNVDSNSKSGNHVINVLPVRLNVKNIPGKLNPKNASYVLETIKMAAKLCMLGKASGMVTGPISKAVLNDGGFKISGHTEFLANLCKCKSVMMLMNKKMRIALHTTHVSIDNISKSITKSKIKNTIDIVKNDMRNKFAIKKPKILVTGLNPHAGEDGVLGKHEINIIKPVIDDCKKQGLHIDGPIPADTAFLKKNVEKYDVILTMFHDQGLPVIKFDNFKTTVNVTLGLPIVRVSVDHGTALDLAGTGKVDISSFVESIKVAKKLSDAQI
tara:strand:- start:5298 stop:6275 length:978 start_codon:yes stop_codon:yes gene_type:complete